MILYFSTMCMTVLMPETDGQCSNGSILYLMPFGVRNICMSSTYITSLKYASIFADVFASTINSRTPISGSGPDTPMRYLKLNSSILFLSTSFSFLTASILSASNNAYIEYSRGIGSNPDSILWKNSFRSRFLRAFALNPLSLLSSIFL
jgi:hypothetical protein